MKKFWSMMIIVVLCFINVFAQNTPKRGLTNDDFPSCNPVKPPQSTRVENISTNQPLNKKGTYRLGNNLISNASFEYDPTGNDSLWFLRESNADLETFWSRQYSKTGSFSLAMRLNNKGDKGWPGWFTKAPIPIQKGQIYIYSVWVYTPDGGSPWVSINYMNEKGSFLMGRSSGCLPEPPIGKWHKYEFIINADDAPGTTQVTLGLQQRILGETKGKNGNIYYDDVYFGPRVN